MRETRTSGSEGGGTTPELPTPIRGARTIIVRPGEVPRRIDEATVGRGQHELTSHTEAGSPFATPTMTGVPRQVGPPG